MISENDLLDFVWFRCLDGYEIRPNPAGRADSTSGVLFDGSSEIHRKGDNFEFYHPRLSKDLHREFSRIETELDVLAFVQKWGFIGFAGKSGKVQSESVEHILNAAKKLKLALHEFDNLQRISTKSNRRIKAAVISGDDTTKEQAEIETARDNITKIFNENAAPRVRVHLKRIKNAPGFALSMQPLSLLGAFWINISDEFTSSLQPRPCLICGAPILIGPGAKARSDRETCSERCKSALYRKRKAEKLNTIKEPSK